MNGDDLVINENVDNKLKEMEIYFKEAVEGNKPLQDELNAKVKELMDAHDEKEEVKKFESVKAMADFIALALSMPITDETKERIIVELVKECEEKYGVVQKEI